MSTGILKDGAALATDGFFLVHERDDGLFVSVFAPVGSGRGVTAGDLRRRLMDFGAAEVDGTVLAEFVKRTDGKAYRICALPGTRVFIPENDLRKTEVRVSDDGMQAFLTFVPLPGESQKDAEGRVHAALRDSGVTHGIFRSFIREVAASGRPVFEVIVAEGAVSQAGADGRIEFFFEHDPDTSPLLRADGTVDHRETNMIQNVVAGARLIHVVPETPGKPGRRVDGATAIPVPGEQPPPVYAGPGVKALEDGRTFIAEVDGHAMFLGGILRVVPTFIVAGDVDYNTGNIKMKGSVIVKGTVRNGFNLRAEGDIEIFGAVESATVISSSGSVWIHGGIAGGDSARVGATRDVTARFIERASVVAGRSVMVEDTILNSEVSAKDDVLVNKGKGVIIGGVTRAERRICVKQLGSDTGKATEARIELIEAPRLYSRISELDRVLYAMQEEHRRLEMLLDRYPKDTIGADAALVAIKASMEELVTRRRINAAEKRDIERRLSGSGEGEIEVLERIYERVVVAIGRSSHRIDARSPGALFFRVGEVIKWK